MLSLVYEPQYEICRSHFGDPQEADELLWELENKIANEPMKHSITEFPDLRMYLGEVGDELVSIYYRVDMKSGQAFLVRIYSQPKYLTLAA